MEPTLNGEHLLAQITADLDYLEAGDPDDEEFLRRLAVVAGRTLGPLKARTNARRSGRGRSDG